MDNRFFKLPPLRYDFFDKEEDLDRSAIYQFGYHVDELDRIKAYFFDFCNLNDGSTASFIVNLFEVLFTKENDLLKESLSISSETAANNFIHSILTAFAKVETLLEKLNQEDKKGESNLLSGALRYCKKHIKNYLEQTKQAGNVDCYQNIQKIFDTNPHLKPQ